MVDPKFAGAFIDGSESQDWSSARILGVRLRKFSLWHRLILRAGESPFFTKDKYFDMHDLRTAVGVCRNRYGDSRIRRPRLTPFILWFGRLIPGGRVGDLNRAQRILQKQADKFVFYCGDYLQEPDFAIINRESGPRAPTTPIGKAPRELELAWLLASQAGFTWEQAWNTPVGQAHWIEPLALRAQGVTVDFVNEAERQYQEQMPDEYRWAKRA